METVLRLMFKSIQSNATVARCFALDARAMITIHASVSKKPSGFRKLLMSKLMLSGFRKMLRYVLGARRQCKGLWDVTLWLANAVKASAICVHSLGSRTTKTTSNAIYTRKSQMRK